MFLPVWPTLLVVASQVVQHLVHDCAHVAAVGAQVQLLLGQVGQVAQGGVATGVGIAHAIELAEDVHVPVA